MRLRSLYRFSEETNFGFKKVNINEKQSFVNQVFDSVSNKYSL